MQDLLLEVSAEEKLPRSIVIATTSDLHRKLNQKSAMGGGMGGGDDSFMEPMAANAALGGGCGSWSSW